MEDDTDRRQREVLATARSKFDQIDKELARQVHEEDPELQKSERASMPASADTGHGKWDTTSENFNAVVSEKAAEQEEEA